MSSAIEPLEAEAHQRGTSRTPDASHSTWSRLVDAVVERFTGFDLPLFELELPDGTMRLLGTIPRRERSGAARFRLRVRNQAGARALGSFDEARTADAFMNGDLDVEGDFLAAFELRKCFSDHHPFWSLWRFIPPLLLGQVKSDRSMIPRHYDVGDDFNFRSWTGTFVSIRKRCINRISSRSRARRATSSITSRRPAGCSQGAQCSMSAPGGAPSRATPRSAASM